MPKYLQSIQPSNQDFSCSILSVPYLPAARARSSSPCAALTSAVSIIRPSNANAPEPLAWCSSKASTNRRAEGQHCLDILALEPGAGRIDPDQLLGAAEIQYAQRCGDALASFGFTVERHPVFHVHADAVHPQGEGFFDLMPVMAGHVEQGAAWMHGFNYRTKKEKW
jgi:hypothetical protein